MTAKRIYNLETLSNTLSFTLLVLFSPATSQAQIMAKVFSTFNRAEQGRFEAFRRSTFSSDAVAKYVAQCLIAESYPSDDGRQPILSHLTAPGQANEITIVVSTLAKLYAQRLVTSAREFADDGQPVEPEHILKAFEERRAQGLDPGLFLQPQIPSTRSNNITLNNDSFQKRRLVALELQELYDKQQSSDDGGDKESAEKEDSMNVDD